MTVYGEGGLTPAQNDSISVFSQPDARERVTERS